MQPKFSADEKVLCYHGPLLYEAKILKSKKEVGSYNYFVHYQVGMFGFFIFKTFVNLQPQGILALVLAQTVTKMHDVPNSILSPGMEQELG